MTLRTLARKFGARAAIRAAFVVGFDVVLGAAGPNSSAEAATAVGSFSVTITITVQCAVSNATTMAFPSTGLLSASVNQTSSFTVTCTNTTPYSIGLDAGANASGAQRRMRGGVANSEYVGYNLYSDAARTTPWGNSSGTMVNGTGAGAGVGYTIYGQVPAQATPSPGANYSDTVTITVIY